MHENRLQGNATHAQPLLRGINLARFLCERCPFNRLTEERRSNSGNGSGLPPSDAVVQSKRESGPSCADDLGLPGRL